MQFLLKVIAVAFVVIALVAPRASQAACADAECAGTPDVCTCVCHPEPAEIRLSSHRITSPALSHLLPVDRAYPAAFLATDIFRPPIAA
jgi:hypothetical protein